MITRNGVIIISGGVDSVSLLYYLINVNSDYENNLHALTFSYGQKHLKEIEYAKYHCSKLHIPYKVIDIVFLKDILHSALTTDIKIPQGKHYTDENQKVTIVPNRNQIFLSIAAGYAVSNKLDTVYYAAHANDRAIYPDCRPEFVKAIDTATYLANIQSPVQISAPFIHKTKSEIVSIGLNLGIEYEKTWSCYYGKDVPCSMCSTCLERIEAFFLNGERDPLYSEEKWEKLLQMLKEKKLIKSRSI